MEHPASTLAFDRAMSPPDRSSTPAEIVDRAHLDRRAQRAEVEHTNHMMVAVGLYLVGGGVLSSFGQISTTLAAIAVACFMGGVVLQHRAHRRLRAALIERAIANGAPPAEATAAVDASLGERLR